MSSGHPLDPLTAEEIRAAAAIVKAQRGVTDRWRFASIDLKEPSKQALADRAEAPPRTAEVVCWNRDDGNAYKGVVSLTDERVVTWEERPGEYPPMTPDEFHECDAALRTEPRVIEALARRGVTEMDLVLFDTWAYGAELVPERYRGRRIGWTDVWHRNSPEANPYANMLSGLHPVVDMNTMELLELEDVDPGPAPAIMGEYTPALVPGLKQRTDLRALDITQPDGPSFTLDGNHLQWQKWSMRLGFNFREGLVIHTLTYDDAGRTRKVAHRMSFAEMVVPYRDPTPDHYRRTAFDIGEWGLGLMTTSLELGCDCLGEIAYLDAVLHDSRGEPHTIKNAICIHEEDNGVLWKHVDDHTGAETRRMRRLVVSFHATVANYEYLVYWRFNQDGNIECEVRATGLMVTTPFAGDKPPYGTLIDNRTYAPFHQHFIVARLDLDVDGEDNTVYAADAVPVPTGPDNPYGLALTQTLTPLADGARRHPGLRLAAPAHLEGAERQRRQRPRHPGRLQARAECRDPVAARPRLAGGPAGARDRAHAVGHALLRGRALAVWRVSEPERRGLGPAGVDRKRPADREHRRRALVRVWHQPRDEARGLAGYARRHGVVLAEARRLLRPQPGARRTRSPGPRTRSPEPRCLTT